MVTKILLSLKLVICLFCLLPLQLWAQAGKLDTSFGVNGLVITDINAFNDYGFSTKIQGDGKILVAGFGHIDSFTNNDFVLMRLLPDGSPDMNFGNNGMVITDFLFGGDDVANAMCLQTDGKIVLAGQSLNAQNNYDIALLRILPNGMLDSSFGGDGRVTTDLGGINDYGQAVLQQADGKIVVTGYTNAGGVGQLATLRYQSNGNLDPSFNDDGKATFTYEKIYIEWQSMAIQSDGKILACANTQLPSNDYDIVLIRYLPNGQLDSSFNQDGVVITDFCYTDKARKMAIQLDGKILVTGSSYDTVNIAMGVNMMLIRYTTQGNLDSSFGNNGKVITEVTDKPDIAFDLTVQPDGKIITLGHSADGVNFKIIMVRYHPDGLVDPGFGINGMVVNNLANSHEFAESVALQPDGKMVITGFINDGTGFDIFTARYTADGPAQVITQADDFKIWVAPMPFTNQTTIRWERPLSKPTLEVFNGLGQLVFKERIMSGNHFILNFQNMASGNYYLLLKEENLLKGKIKLLKAE